MSILFVSHDASRTGAPIVLLHLLRQLKKEQFCTFFILLIDGGELEEEFRAIAPTYIWRVSTPGLPYWKRYPLRLIGMSNAKRQAQNEKSIIDYFRKQDINIVYGNTVVTSEVITQLKHNLNCFAVCHVHELEIAIERYFGTIRFGVQIPSIDLIIAASDAVRDNIIKTYPTAIKPIAKVYEFVPSSENVETIRSAAEIRENLAIPADSPIIAASGTLDWRKSPDIFVQVASYIRRHKEKMPYFIWVGGHLSSISWLELQYDLQRLGIADYVKFVGSSPNPLDYLRTANLFILTSREDPYPLVCLEAASIGIPIICFAQAGGMPEFVEEDCGIVVPFLHVDAMAQAVCQLLDNPEQCQEMGANALLKVRARHSVELASQQVYDNLNTLLKN